MATSLKSRKSEPAPLPPRGQSRFWQAQQSQLSSSLAVRQVDISFECMLLRALMQRLLPRVPKWVGQQCKGRMPGHFKEMKSAQENKICLLFLIKWSTVPQVTHMKQKSVCLFCSSFSGLLTDRNFFDVHSCYSFYS